jgi:F0F1-type ATP synthase assembly protein I
MGETERELKQRNKQIAQNESERQTVSAVRLSTWAVAIAVLIGIAVFGWVMLR